MSDKIDTLARLAEMLDYMQRAKMTVLNKHLRVLWEDLDRPGFVEQATYGMLGKESFLDEVFREWCWTRDEWVLEEIKSRAAYDYHQAMRKKHAAHADE